MERPQTVDTSTLAVSGTTGLLNTATKKMVILVRWPVVIVCAFLLLSPFGEEFEPSPVHGFVPFYLLSNVVLNYVNQRSFQSPYFYIPLVIFDILILTASLIISGQTSTDFYLAYFLIIMLTGLTQDFRGLVVVSLIATFVYGYFLFSSTQVFDSSILLRLPFLFIVALFCGYFTQLVREEKALSMARIYQLKSDLLNIMSHELRTPLSVIIGSAWVLQEKKLGEMNAQQEKIVEKVMQSSKGLLDLVNTILEASRIETGPLKMNIDEFDLGAFLDELKLLYDTQPAKELKLTWDYPSELPVMKTDKIKLKIILQNLINNGIKFTEKGTVTVSARHLPAEKRVEVKVADTGIGIPKESLPDIFGMFYQADRSATSALSGVGLGLYIVKTFTELLGGSIAVESERNRGSSFTVTIPEDKILRR